MCFRLEDQSVGNFRRSNKTHVLTIDSGAFWSKGKSQEFSTK